jgi:hypothetical protein
MHCLGSSGIESSSGSRKQQRCQGWHAQLAAAFETGLI